jgi:hypothetical protein
MLEDWERLIASRIPIYITSLVTHIVHNLGALNGARVTYLPDNGDYQICVGLDHFVQGHLMREGSDGTLYICYPKFSTKIELLCPNLRLSSVRSLTGCDADQAVKPLVRAVQPGDTEKLPGDISSTPMVCDDKLTSATNVEDDEQFVNYSLSPEHVNMDTNAPYMGVFVLMGEDDYHAEFGPEEDI